jgi:hypothetical protein
MYLIRNNLRTPFAEWSAMERMEHSIGLPQLDGAVPVLSPLRKTAALHELHGDPRQRTFGRIALRHARTQLDRHDACTYLRPRASEASGREQSATGKWAAASTHV